MTNREKYADEIIDISTYSRLAVNKDTHKPCSCGQVKCINCLLYCGEGCRAEAQKWLEEKYMPNVDWSKVEVDTKVLASEYGDCWNKRYFAKYEDGKVYTWANGATSWSSEDEDVICWKYVKLYEE